MLSISELQRRYKEELKKNDEKEEYYIDFQQFQDDYITYLENEGGF